MSKKGDGKKKGGKDEKTSSPVAKAAKPAKIPGPRPESYAPRAKMAPVEVVSDKAENIWHGYCDLVEITGMLFRVSKLEHNVSGHEFRLVHVVSAPPGTELYGIAGSRIYVTVADIHSQFFRSPFKEGTPDHERQERIWNFFDRLFRNMNLKGAHAEKAEETLAA